MAKDLQTIGYATRSQLDAGGSRAHKNLLVTWWPDHLSDGVEAAIVLYYRDRGDASRRHLRWAEIYVQHDDEDPLAYLARVWHASWTSTSTSSSRGSAAKPDPAHEPDRELMELFEDYDIPEGRYLLAAYARNNRKTDRSLDQAHCTDKEVMRIVRSGLRSEAMRDRMRQPFDETAPSLLEFGHKLGRAEDAVRLQSQVDDVQALEQQSLTKTQRRRASRRYAAEQRHLQEEHGRPSSPGFRRGC